MPPAASQSRATAAVQDWSSEPSGLFEPDGETVAAVVEKPLDEDDVIAITIEPDGGSRQPTTHPMLTAKL